MKKRMLALLVVAMSVFCLVGCGNSLTGTWSAENNGQEGSYTFNDDGTGNIKVEDISVDITWETDGDELTIVMTMLGESEELKYTYEIDGDVLTLTDEDDETLELNKE